MTSQMKRQSKRGGDRVLDVPARVKVVMAMLEKAAESGQACPGNSEFAVAIGQVSMSAGANVIALMEANGMISVERGKASRVVTILATGKRTAGTISRPIRLVAQPPRPKGFWTVVRDATLMEAIAQGLDFEQAANWVGCEVEVAAARFDALAADMGAQAA